MRRLDTSPSSMGTSSPLCALRSSQSGDSTGAASESASLPPPVPLPTVDLGPLLAQRTRTQAAVYRTPRPLKVCCVTWNANGRMVGPEVLQDWLMEALTEQKAAKKGGKPSGGKGSTGAAAALRSRVGSAAGTAAAALAAAANAGAAAMHGVGGDDDDNLDGMAASSGGQSGGAVAAAETKNGDDDDSDSDEEVERPSTSVAAPSDRTPGLGLTTAAAPAHKLALTPEEFVEMNELTNKAFLNDDEQDRLQSLMAAQKQASLAAPPAAPPPPPAVQPPRLSAKPFETQGEPLQDGEEPVEGSGLSGDRVYAKLRESVSPYVPQRSKVVKRCRGCGEGTSKAERDVCKTCGASNDWSTIMKGTSATGAGAAGALAGAGGLNPSSANSSSSSLDYGDNGSDFQGENAEFTGTSDAAASSSSFQKPKKKKGLLGKLFVASDGNPASSSAACGGDETDSSHHKRTGTGGGNMEVADVIAIGLQEIIELSAANVVVESMTDNGSREATGNWVSNIGAALRLVSEKLAAEQAQDGYQGLLSGSSAWSGSFSYQVCRFFV